MSIREHIQLEPQIATWPYRTSNVIKIRTTTKKGNTVLTEMTDPDYEGEVELMLALGMKKYAENTGII